MVADIQLLSESVQRTFLTEKGSVNHYGGTYKAIGVTSDDRIA